MEQQDITAEWLATQESFQTFVLSTDTELRTDWEQWLIEHPEKRAVYQEARTIVQQLSLQVSEQEIGAEWHQLQQRLPQQQQRSLKQRPALRKPLQLTAAAFLIGLITFWYWPATQAIPLQEVNTAVGTTQEVNLSDGSLVVLNANSSLRYADFTDDQPTRELWLEGEAFFEVEHRPDQAFVVHTSRGDIKVLGTTFNLSDRADRFSATLVEGSIEYVDGNDQAIPLQANQQIRIENGNLSLEAIDPEVVTAWRYNQMVFKNTPVFHIIERLQQDFNWKITVTDEAILQRKITAQIPENDPELLLEALSVLYDLNIQQLSEREYLFE